MLVSSLGHADAQAQHASDAIRSAEDILADPALNLAMMKSSGFRVDLGDMGSMVFIPDGHGAYGVTGRLAPVKNTKHCTLKEHPSNRFPSFTLCQIDNWKAPRGFEKSLAYGGMKLGVFWKRVEKDMLVSGPQAKIVKVQVLNLDTNLNTKLRKSEAGTYRQCWEILTTKYSPTLKTPTSKRADCRIVKDALELLQADKRGRVVDEELRVATERNDAATERLRVSTENLERATRELEEELGIPSE